MALETAKQEGMAFPWLSEWQTGNWKTSCRFGRIDVSVMNSATSIPKDGLENMIFPDGTSLYTLRQAAKKEVERDLMAQIQSYAKELQTTLYAVAFCCFPSSSFHSCWTQGLLLNLNYPLLYWVAPNYEEFQQLDDSKNKHDQIIQISRLKALFPILFQTCSVKIFQKLWTWSLWSWLLLKTSSSGPRSLAEEHSDELKNLALEDAVKSTIGQKKQLEVHGFQKMMIQGG